ncbi:MAG TPA: NAD(P)H-binding protein [Chryseolinea sp.]|nr:NAD(P)H-binding protein [Chryseolinea sp.]
MAKAFTFAKINGVNMKRVIIIGASGSLAQYVIEALKGLNEVELTLFVRNKNRLSTKVSTGCTLVEGDAMNYNDVEKAVSGHDIVYVNLAGHLETMAKNIVQAMEEMNVKRIIAISSIGIYQTPLRSVLIPYRRLADIVESSKLDYTILRPDWFTDADEIKYAITRKGEPEKGTAISRKSIAAFIATIIQSPELYTRENLGISKPEHN